MKSPLYLISVWCLCWVFSTACAVAPTKLPKLNVEEVIARNAEALKAIQCYEYDIEWEEAFVSKFPDSRDQWLSRKSTSHFIKNGPSVFFSTSQISTIGERPEKNRACAAIINPNYSASFNKDGEEVFYFEHASPEMMVGLELGVIIPYNPPEAIRFGYRTGYQQALLDRYQNKRVARAWTVTEKRDHLGDRIYQLEARQTQKDGGVKVEFTADVNPNKGHLITHHKYYKPSGELWSEWTVTPQKANYHLHFPQEVSFEEYGILNKPIPHFGVIRKLHFRISNLKLNHAVPAEAFELSALKVPNGTRVHYYPLAERKEERIFYGNAMLPDKIYRLKRKYEKEARATAPGQ